jgi:hypothetical protein
VFFIGDDAVAMLSEGRVGKVGVIRGILFVAEMRLALMMMVRQMSMIIEHRVMGRDPAKLSI